MEKCVKKIVKIEKLSPAPMLPPEGGKTAGECAYHGAPMVSNGMGHSWCPECSPEVFEVFEERE